MSEDRTESRHIRGPATARQDGGKRPLIDRVLAMALPSRRRRLPGISLGVLADICVVGLLALSMWLIVRAGEQPPILYLTFEIVGVRALAIGRASFRYVERLASHDAALRQLSVLRQQTFRALVPRVPGGLAGAGRGEVLQAFVADVDQLQDDPLRVRQPLIVSGLVVTLSLLCVALVSPAAAGVLLLCLLAGGAAAAFFSYRFASAADVALAAARAKLTDLLLERFEASEVLQAFGAEEAQLARVREAEAELVRLQLARVRAAGVTAAVLSLAAGLASLGVLLLLAPSLGSPGMSAPMFAALVVVPAAVFEVFAQVPAALVARRTVRGSAERVAELTLAPLPEELPQPDDDTADETADDAARLLGDGITADGLTARYPGAARDSLGPVSFTLAPGEVLVVTGDSGAGKSTLAQVLVRLLEYRGSYRIGGHEARELPQRVVRSIVGLAEQEPHLFASDLRQNLKFAHDTASDEELLEVLDRVGLGAWARERGLDAAMGERGQLVSGGQAQRIALARVLLAEFPVVVLDEPTAGVDRELADSLLADLLGAVPADRAVLLITHTDLPAGIAARTLRLTPPPQR